MIETKAELVCEFIGVENLTFQRDELLDNIIFIKIFDGTDSKMQSFYQSRLTVKNYANEANYVPIRMKTIKKSEENKILEYF
jgi:hypothetical protein